MKPRMVPMAVGILALLAGNVWAHPAGGDLSASGLSAGLAHPWLGFDHMLAMLAVGMLAVQLGGRARWLLPLSFLIAMLAGGLIGVSSLGAGFAEFTVAFSVLALGTALAIGRHYPLAAVATLTALFGIFHGHLHGTELPAGATVSTYWAGLLIATASLHAGGTLLAWFMTRICHKQPTMRWTGAAIALAGAIMMAAAL